MRPSSNKRNSLPTRTGLSGSRDDYQRNSPSARIGGRVTRRSDRLETRTGQPLDLDDLFDDMLSSTSTANSSIIESETTRWATDRSSTVGLLRD